MIFIHVKLENKKNWQKFAIRLIYDIFSSHVDGCVRVCKFRFSFGKVYIEFGQPETHS